LPRFAAYKQERNAMQTQKSKIEEPKMDGDMNGLDVTEAEFARLIRALTDARRASATLVAVWESLYDSAARRNRRFCPPNPVRKVPLATEQK
jgi:hypothetical protein